MAAVRSEISIERTAQAVFIGLLFAPVAGMFTLTIVGTIRFWSAEPGGLWAVPVLMGLEHGFVTGTVTGLLLGLLTAWPLSDMSMARALGITFLTTLLISLLNALLELLFEATVPAGTINTAPMAAHGAAAVGYILLALYLFAQKRSVKS